MAVTKPELPVPAIGRAWEDEFSYTDEQMLAYGRACTEYAAEKCDTEWNGDSDTYAYAEACNECADAIRDAAEGLK